MCVQSKLTIVADRGKGILGEAELNLSDYKEKEYRIMKLELKNCSDPDAYIEIGLRATLAKEKTASTPKGERESNTSVLTGSKD